MKSSFGRAHLLALSLALVPGAHSAPAVDVSGMDTSVAPGDDFFACANGVWLRTNDIPSDQSSYGTWYLTQELVESRQP